jgi:pimeloyl-ACP methyl ester carboxylesterase
LPSLWFESYGAAIRWHDLGQGTPLVILTGLSMDVRGTFAAMIARPYWRDRRLILVDVLGSGASDHPTGFDYGLDSHATSVAAVMDHLGLAGADVLGYSMGGSVAIALTQARPDLVGHLILAEANLFPGGGVASRGSPRRGLRPLSRRDGTRSSTTCATPRARARRSRMLCCRIGRGPAQKASIATRSCW